MCTIFFPLILFQTVRYFHGRRPWLRRGQGSRDGGKCAHHRAHRLACCQVNKVKYNKRGWETYREARSLYKRKVGIWYAPCWAVSSPVCHCIMVLIGRSSISDDGGWWWWEIGRRRKDCWTLINKVTCVGVWTNLNKNKSIEFEFGVPVRFHTQVAKALKISLYHLFPTGSKSFEVPDPHDQAVLAICDDRPKCLSRLEIVSARSISRNSRSYHIIYVYLVVIVLCLTKCPCTSYVVFPRKTPKTRTFRKIPSWLWKTAKMACESERHSSQAKIPQRWIFQRRRHQRHLPRDEDAEALKGGNTRSVSFFYPMCRSFTLCVALLPYVSLTRFGECVEARIHCSKCI